MKTTLFLLLSLFTFSTLSAQKVKLRNHQGAYMVTQLPDKVLDPSIKTYSTLIQNNSTELWGMGMKKTDLEYKYLKIHGLQRVKTKGDLLIELNIGQFKIVKEELKETLKSLKGGTEASNKQYHYEFQYHMPISMAVYNGDEKIYSSLKEQTSVTQKFSSPKFATSAAASKNRKQYYSQWINTPRADEINKKAMNYYKSLNARYGYKPIEVPFKLHKPNAKKAPDQEAFANEVVKTAELLVSLKANAPIPAELKAQLADQVSAWSEAGKGYSPTDKTQAKLFQAYTYNAMQTAFVIEDFATAKSLAQTLIDNSTDKAFAKKIINDIGKAEEAMKRVGVSSRYLALASEEAELAAAESGKGNSLATATADEARDQALGLHEYAKEFPIKLTSRAEKISEGILVVDYSDYEDAYFFRGGNVAYFVGNDEVGYTKKELNLSRYNAFQLGERSFELIHPKTSLTGGGNVAYSIVELVESTDKMQLYTIHPANRDDVGQVSLTGNFMIKKTGDKHQNLNGVKYLNFKKAFSKYIADCPALAEQVAAGKYKRSKIEDLMKIVEAYTNCN